MYIYPSHFNCAWAVGHVRYVYTVTWACAQSRSKMEKEQLKRDHAEMEQEQSKRDRARAQIWKQRDTASEESKIKEKESDRLRKK